MKHLILKRSIYLSAVFIFAIVIGAITLVNLRSVIDMSLAQIHQQGRVERIISVQRYALKMQMDFRSQIQEWKNLLILSSNNEEFAKNLANFEKSETSVRRLLDILGNRADIIGETISEDLQKLQQAHNDLGQKYRAALASFDPDEPASLVSVNRNVQGLERQPLAHMEKLVRDIRSMGDLAISKDLDEMTKVRKGTIFVSFLTVGVGLILVPLFLGWIYRSYLALNKAREKALTASMAKSEFVSNVGHEIRTPLNGIIGMLEMLQTTQLDKTQKDYVDTIFSSSQNLEAVLNDILDYSKIEARVIELQPTVFPVKTAINAVVDLFQPLARDKNLDLRVHYDKGVPEKIECDEVRLRQILVNLVYNAVKFTKQGHIELRVSWKLEAQLGLKGMLNVEIEDTGIGIEAGLLETLFEPFNRSDASTPRRSSGTGLGLTICKHLVNLMGGSLTAKSEYNKGSTFYLTVKANKESALGHNRSPKVPIRTTPKKDVSLNITDEALKNARILIAEDNSVNTKVAVLLTKHLGLEPDVVVNGAEAVTAFTKKRYDIILMDLQMPIMDGKEATRKIREITGDIETPWIIAQTASAMTQNRDDAFEAGINDFIAKPINIETLRDKLSRCLKRKAKLSEEKVLAAKG